MNNDLLYNIALTSHEVEDVMNTLADKANLLSALQKKIYGQAIQQRNAFEAYSQEQTAVPSETVYDPSEEPVVDEAVSEEVTKEEVKD